MFARLAPPRHPDAGPEGGAHALAKTWLAETAELTREALAFARRTLAITGQSGLDTLLAALGQPLSGLVSARRSLAPPIERLGAARPAPHARRRAPARPPPTQGRGSLPISWC